MALKDLVAQKSALTEEAIETIVSDYIRYDIDEQEIAFLPSFASLSNKAKVLVYLVAQQGWEFVVDGQIATSTKPADLENELGIPGGSLRPLLKDLKDRHLLNVKSGHYHVRASSLASIKEEMQSPDGSKTNSTKKPNKKRTKTKTKEVQENNSSQKRTTGKGNTGVKERFEQWVEEGFFDDGKVLADVQKRFHDEAIIVSKTSMPSYLLGGVRNAKLVRSKETVNGKLLWVYKTKK